jgi:hypothetical protein
MKQFEQQFEAHLDALKKDGHAASIFVYTEITLHHFFGGDTDLLDRVNEHAGFWNGVLAALQASGFISLGRMYDEDSGTHTIHALLRFIEDYKGLFRPNALEIRRQAAGMTSEDARSFAEGSWTLKASDLLPIREEFEQFRQLYKTNIEPIRNKVFAHTGKIDRHQLNALFTKVFLRDLERIVVFPLRLERALVGLHQNGIAPTLESPRTNMVEVLNNLPGDRTSTWEHFHAVKSAAAIAAWMKLTPAPVEKIDASIITRLVRAMQLEQLGLTEEDFEEAGPDQTNIGHLAK